MGRVRIRPKEEISIVAKQSGNKELAEEVIGHCPKCNAKRIIKKAKSVTMMDGRPAIKGVCGKCGTGMYKIWKRQPNLAKKVKQFVLNSDKEAEGVVTSINMVVLNGHVCIEVNEPDEVNYMYCKKDDVLKWLKDIQWEDIQHGILRPKAGSAD